jgi:hypothetical protein
VWHVFDHYLGVNPIPDYLTFYGTNYDNSLEQTRRALSQAAAARDSTSTPSLPLERYAQTYTDRWYGDIAVEMENGKLVIRFTKSPSLVGDMVHWQHDTWAVRWRDRTLRADAYITFSLDATGKIREARMVPESDAVDFSYDFQDLVLVPRSGA